MTLFLMRNHVNIIKSFLLPILLLGLIFFNEIVIWNLRVRILILISLFITGIFSLKRRYPDLFYIHATALLLFFFLFFFNGWYNKFDVYSSVTWYIFPLVMFSLGYGLYSRNIFCFISILVILVHFLFFFIQLILPSVYEQLFSFLNSQSLIRDIDTGYFITGFRASSIMSSYDLIFFGSFIVMFFWVRKEKLFVIIFTILLFLGSLMLFSRSNLFILLLFLFLFLLFSRYYLLFISYAFIVMLGIFSILNSTNDIVFTAGDITRQIDMRDGNRGEFQRQTVTYVLSENIFISGYNNRIDSVIDKAPHNVFLNGFLYFGLVGLLYSLFFYGKIAYKFFAWRNVPFEFVVIFCYLLKTMFHNESFITNGSPLLLFLIGGMFSVKGANYVGSNKIY